MPSIDGEKIDALLKAIQITSLTKRSIFFSKIITIVTLLAILSDIMISGLQSNFMKKAILIHLFLFSVLARYLIARNQNISFFISIAIVEIFNIAMTIYAFKITPDLQIIWAQASTAVALFLQGYCNNSIKLLIFFSIKQPLIWIVSGLLFSELSIDDLSASIPGTLGLVSLFFCCGYFDNLKDAETFASKLQVQDLNTKFLSLLDALSDFICVLSPDIVVIYANKNMERILNDRSGLQYLMQCSYHRRYSENVDVNASIINDILVSFNKNTGKEVEFGILENNKEFIEWKGKLILWNSSLSMVFLGKNVSNIMKIEKLVTENQYKSSLLRNVSHELRTPTNAIISMAQILNADKTMSDSNKEKIEIISSSCNYQLCLINDLLDYSQIVAGCLKITLSSFNLKKLLMECVDLIKIQLNHPKVKVDLNISENIPDIIITDPYRLKQIVLNFLTNAKKFTPEGLISLESILSEKKMTINCRDTGIGIPREKLSLLFTQFGKIEDSAALNPQGVGLGLLISNMLVKELGGKHIKVSSDVGKGSCFSFTIPVQLQESDPLDIPEENSSITIPSIYIKSMLKKAEVLIVDDTEFNIKAITYLLKAEGILCTYVLNGYDAVSLIRNKDYCCVLMDCEMPIIDGWETTKIIRDLYENKEIAYLPPIIAITAHEVDTVKEKCLEYGMCDALSRPCDRELLISKVKYWIQIYQANASAYK